MGAGAAGIGNSSLCHLDSPGFPPSAGCLWIYTAVDVLCKWPPDPSSDEARVIRISYREAKLNPRLRLRPRGRGRSCRRRHLWAARNSRLAARSTWAGHHLWRWWHIFYFDLFKAAAPHAPSRSRLQMVCGNVEASPAKHLPDCPSKKKKKMGSEEVRAAEIWTVFLFLFFF